jgi:predicted ATPase/class 3 adenylate cyclase
MDLSAALAFIPIDRRHALAHGETLPEHTRGTALFADISGFTPLTEALSRMLGPQRGAEEISRQLNQVYDALIAEVERYGGSVINFSGDAITCWFDQDAGERATASALMMQKAMARFSSFALPNGGMVMLAMKAALAGGPVRRFVVGNPDIQLIDVLAGYTLRRMSVVEHHSQRNEVVMSPECYPVIADSALVTEWRADREGNPGTVYPVIGGLLNPVEPKPWPDLSLDTFTAETVRPWLLPPVYERLGEGQSKFLAELRPATALFLRFSGIDYDDDPEAGHKLNTYLCWVQEQIHHYEGFLLQVTVGDKGSYLYAAFGAPIAHDDDIARAAAVAQKLQASGEAFDFIDDVQIGLHHGRMRAGPYGGHARRTYGVLGDDVNLAARLMQAAAPGRALASQSIAENTALTFEWEPLPAINVKGKVQRIPVYQLAQHDESLRRMTGRLRHNADYQTPIVGRELERDQLLLALQGLLNEKQSGVLVVEGEAGIGKSRLLDEVRQAAYRLNAPVLTGAGDAIEKTPYRAWQEIIFALIGWDDAPDQTARQRAALAAIGSQWEHLAPLLNPVVGTDLFPANALTRSLTGKALADSTREVLFAILQQAASRAPLTLILEDAHWLDSSAWMLAQAVQQRTRSRATAPILLILATRPMPEPSPAEYAQILQTPDAVRLRLSPLPKHDVLTLVSQRLGAERLPEPVAALIQSKAEGNPFFSEELAFALRDAGLIEISAGQCRVAPGVDLHNVALPDTVQGVITSRIDRLAAAQQLTLKVASAIGREFAFRTLRDIHPVDADKPRLTHYLEALGRLELTAQEAATEAMYLFKHTITQDVAYNLMLFAQRRELHQAIGEWYEQEYSGHLPQVYPVLAHHWGRAAEGAAQHIELTLADRVTQKALMYLTQAGEQALQISAFREAVAAFEGALMLASQATTRRLDNTVVRAMLLVKLGNTFEAMSDFRQATERLKSGLTLAQAAQNNSLAAEALSGLCWVAARQGAHADARALAEQALAQARAADDKTTMALALRRLGALSKGDRAAAIRYYEESLALYRALNDQKGIAACFNNLGNMAAGQSDYAGAILYYSDGLAMARAAGDRLVVGTFLGNLGEIARRQAEFEKAIRYLEEALELLREIGAREGVATNMLNLGEVAAARGDDAAAARYYRDALVEASAIGALPRALGALTGIAGVWARRGDEAHLLRAAQLVGLTLAHPAGNAAVHQDAEPVLEALRQALPAATLTAAQAQGAARALDEVMTEIIRE